MQREFSPPWNADGFSSDPILSPSSPCLASPPPKVRRKSSWTKSSESQKFTPSTAQRGKKSIADSLNEISAAERAARLKITKINATEKTNCESLKRKAAVEVERLRIEFEREEGARKREHEMQMMRARIELARELQGAGTSASAGSLLAELQTPLRSQNEAATWVLPPFD